MYTPSHHPLASSPLNPNPLAQDIQVSRRYYTKRCLGRGGCGIVHEAENDLGEKAARKVEYSSNDLALQRIRRFGLMIEAAVAQQGFRGVPAFIGAETDLGREFAVLTQLIEGETLQTYITRSKTEKSQKNILYAHLASIAENLQQLHDRGIVHRDIKPSNLLISNTQIPYMADWGSAKVPVGLMNKIIAQFDLTEYFGDPLPSLDSFFTTAPYSAPEELLETNPSAKSDVYSLGTILYEIVTGSWPYSFQSGGRHYNFHYRKTNLPNFDPSHVRQFGPILKKSLADDPAERPNAQEFAGMLRGVIGT